MFKLRKSTYLRKIIILILNLMAAVCLKKNLGHGHVYHCVATPFFNNSLETSGN